MAEAADAVDRDEIRGARPETLTALYVVTPAQVSGAASKGSIAVGHLADVARRRRARTPRSHRRSRSRCSSAARTASPGRSVQYSHSPHAQPSHGMATRSPSRTRVTPRSERSTMPTPSWPGTNGGRRLHRPVAVRGVDVGVAEARCLDLHEHLTVARLRDRPVLDDQWLLERRDDCRLHCGTPSRSHMACSLGRCPGGESGPTATSTEDLQLVFPGRSASGGVGIGGTRSRACRTNGGSGVPCASLASKKLCSAAPMSPQLCGRRPRGHRR